MSDEKEVDTILKPEQLCLEVGEGFKLSLGSVKYDVVQLSNIAIQIYKILFKQGKKKNGGYLG